MSQNNDLQQAVIAELRWEPSVTEAHFGVTADKGIISLSGHVESYAEKTAAEAAAGRVKGVRAIANELKVNLPFETKRSDEEIAAAALHRLAWDVSVPKDAVKVHVENGWVTLTGEVNWHFQKAAAAQDVQRLWSVVGVSNKITIKPQVNVSQISDDIMHALHRSWFFDPVTVTVTAKDGKVVLGGTVHGWHERQVAAGTAWSAPGVTEVENNLEVV